MTRYFVPSIGVSAFISSYFGYGQYNKKKEIKTLTDAVWALNENDRVEEAMDFILRSDPEAASKYIPSLSTRSIGALAGRGWPLVNKVPIRKFQLDEDDLCFEKLLDKFELGDEFRAALDWLNRVPCSDEELSCTDSWFGPRPSQTAQLHRILQVLYLKTEKKNIDPGINEGIVQFIFAMYERYREDHKDIAFLALKTLCNVALISSSYAMAILQSEWLHKLSEMSFNGRTFVERLLSHKVFRNALYTLGATDYCLRSNMYEVHLGDSSPAMDIVLIHGLMGSVAYTWRQKDAANKTISLCWPKDWLPLDIVDPIRILGLEYPSYIFQFNGTMESLDARASRYVEQLREAGVGKRPVVFICHSMGGLLAKKLLLKMPDLLENTIGILFIATPHRGSPVATNLGLEIFLPSEDVRFLRETNETNRKLDADFAQIHDRIPIITSMIETKESNLMGVSKGIVVPRDSAVYSKGSLYHIEEVHHNVCKPSERSSPSYGVALNFVRDSLVEAKKRTK